MSTPAIQFPARSMSSYGYYICGEKLPQGNSVVQATLPSGEDTRSTGSTGSATRSLAGSRQTHGSGGKAPHRANEKKAPRPWSLFLHDIHRARDPGRIRGQISAQITDESQCCCELRAHSSCCAQCFRLGSFQLATWQNLTAVPCHSGFQR